jgi:voltage-gated potassium channel Kch
VIIIDTLVGLRHESLLRALYDAARTTATISSPELPNEPAYLIWGFVAALLVMGFTAAFAAGIVQHLLSGRRISLIGRRVVPRAGHVVVVGMGQVGLRLAQEFRALGIAVVGIEREHHTPSLAIARDLSIPVLIGDAASRRMLRRAGLSRAIAIVAAGSEERDNIAVAISAIAEAPNVPVVLRAGADDAIDETRSLFHIGAVVDVNGLTAAFVVQAMLGEIPYAVILEQESLLTLDDAGTILSSSPGTPMRCTC